MSFRRFVGKLVRVTAHGADGGLRYLTAKLFSYDDSGIWLAHRQRVPAAEGPDVEMEGLLFLPLAQIVELFASDDLEKPGFGGSGTGPVAGGGE